MKKIIFLLFASLSFFGLQAQGDTTMAAKKFIPSMAKIKTLDGKMLKGWFYYMNDSQVVLLDKKIQSSKMGQNSINSSSHTFQMDQIHSLSLRKKNSVMKGFLIGLGTGVVTGAVIGFVSGNDPPCDPSQSDIFGLSYAFCEMFRQTAGEKAMVGALGLGTVGAITGIIIGAVVKKKFIIGGKKQRFRDLDAELRQRLLIK